MDEQQSALLALPIILLAFTFIIIMIIANWKFFVKAGKPGWACIVPIYNLWVTCEIAGMPGWAFIGYLIPFVNYVFPIVVTVLLAKKFDKGVGFIIGLILLSPIFYLILAFGDSEYIGD